jgi:hypothetical protein
VQREGHCSYGPASPYFLCGREGFLLVLAFHDLPTEQGYDHQQAGKATAVTVAGSPPRPCPPDGG